MNLIGEHTDDNDGFVLPCAIDYQTVISCAPRDDRKVRAMAADYENQLDEFSLNAPIVAHENYQWANYVRGVVKHLQPRTDFGGVDMVISGNVPQGAGLRLPLHWKSRSEPYCNSFIICRWTAHKSRCNQEAENQFVGCTAGSWISEFRTRQEKDYALLIDCRSLGI